MYWNETIPEKLIEMRATVYDTDILLLGGWINYNHNAPNPDLFVIDTITKSVSTHGPLDLLVARGNPIIVHPYIYYFGGIDTSYQNENSVQINEIKLRKFTIFHACTNLYILL